MKKFFVGQMVRIICQCEFYRVDIVGTVKEVSEDFKKIKVEFNNEVRIHYEGFFWNDRINLWQSFIYAFVISEAK